MLMKLNIHRVACIDIQRIWNYAEFDNNDTRHIEPSDQSAVKKTDHCYQGDGCPY